MIIAPSQPALWVKNDLSNLTPDDWNFQEHFCPAAAMNRDKADDALCVVRFCLDLNQTQAGGS
jgi:hypothetical protein